MKVDLGSQHAGLIWLLLVGMLLLSCEPPRAVPPNMPNAEERAQATRTRLRAFNAARFEQERHDVDSAAHVHAPEAVGLPGGMWLSLDEGRASGCFPHRLWLATACSGRGSPRT